jgi:hypothetical protein
VDIFATIQHPKSTPHHEEKHLDEVKFNDFGFLSPVERFFAIQLQEKKIPFSLSLYY